ncbi:MAG TPA: TonB-dependent receptor [Vicinamibacterales bacterium]|nr:TonB-dependent receptor [Vicinamibacterales bacterium]
MTTRNLILSVILVCFVPLTVFAQGVSLGGRVADTQGGAVVGAVVALSGGDVSIPRTARSGVDGTFLFAPVNPGSYSLQVDAPGFQQATQQVTVADASVRADLTLQIEGVVETLVVAAPKLEEELPQEIERVGVRMQTITSAQIENGGYDDVSQALQALVPGLFVAPKAGPFDYVAASLQGSRINEILWLVDGVRISNRLYNGTTPLDTLPAHMVERIEVIEGGQGLFYGTQAVSGVINVVTKAFSEDANGRVQAGFDNNDGKHVNVFARDTVGAGHRFVLYGSSDRADGYQSFPSAEYASSTTDRLRGYEVLNAGAKYAYDFSDRLRLSAMYQHSDVTLDFLRPARSSASQAGGLSASFNDRTEHIAGGKLDFTASNRAEFFLKTYYHQWDTAFSERLNAASTGQTVVISDQEFWGFKDYGANLLAKLTPHRGFEYFAGYDFQNYSGQDDVLLIAPNTERVHALFGQVRTTRDMFAKGTAAFGLRYNAPTNADGALVWTASGRYDFTPNVFARANVGTSFRYPDAYELFAVDPTCCFGNPNLKPESSTNVNGSVGTLLYTGDTVVNLEAIGFYRTVTDLILDVDDGSGETTITANRPDEVKVRGFSLVGSATLTSALSGSLGYTYTNSERRQDVAGGYDSLPGIPDQLVQASVDLHPPSLPFGAMLTVNRVGEMLNTVAGFGSVGSGDYTLVDLSGRVFVDRSRRHRINLRFENLFDTEYSTQYRRGFPDLSSTPFLVHFLGMPRTFHMSYSFSY